MRDVGCTLYDARCEMWAELAKGGYFHFHYTRRVMRGVRCEPTCQKTKDWTCLMAAWANLRRSFRCASNVSHSNWASRGSQ